MMGALPKALAHRGHRVMVVVPRYDNYEGVVDTGVRRKFNMRGQDVVRMRALRAWGRVKGQRGTVVGVCSPWCSSHLLYWGI